MPTKYAQVAGYPTYYYYVGATTVPDVVPDFLPRQDRRVGSRFRVQWP